jgi:hypothetical protein
MPIIDLTFPNDINVSVQFNPGATTADPKGADIIYFTPTNTVGIHNTADVDPTTGNAAIVELGPVRAINGNVITVYYDTGATLPGSGDFIMFAKHRGANMSSLLGYFAKFRIKNNSTDKAEMYSISVDITESSK